MKLDSSDRFPTLRKDFALTAATTAPPTGPLIQDQEYARRLDHVQAAVRERGLDVLIINGTEVDFGNLRYLSGYWPLFEIAGIAVPPEGPAALLIGPESEAYAEDRSKLSKLHQMVEYRESADPAYPGIAVSTYRDVMADIGVDQPTRIGIGGYLVTTAPVLDGLKASYPEATLERADDIMVGLRSVKSEAELACIARAVEISEAATKRVLEQIKPGMTEQQVVGIAQQAMYAEGAEYEAHPTYVLSGRNSRHAISRPTPKPLERGELIQLNIGARYQGYSPSVGLPITLGPMDDRQRRLVDFGLEAHHKTIEWMKAGVVAKEVAEKYLKFVQDAGFGANYLYGPCHGTGLIEVEPPWMEETSDYPLQQNMTFQVDTFLAESDFGLRWENAGRVTADGFDMFGGEYRRVIEVDV
jgi:Xaa-Pro aminopeptidase